MLDFNVEEVLDQTKEDIVVSLFYLSGDGKSTLSGIITIEDSYYSLSHDGNLISIRENFPGSMLRCLRYGETHYDPQNFIKR